VPACRRALQKRVDFELSHMLFSLFEQENYNAQSQAIPEGRGGSFRRDVFPGKRRAQFTSECACASIGRGH
jgi:hypothetical protein